MTNSSPWQGVRCGHLCCWQGWIVEGTSHPRLVSPAACPSENSLERSSSFPVNYPQLTRRYHPSTPTFLFRMHLHPFGERHEPPLTKIGDDAWHSGAGLQRGRCRRAEWYVGPAGKAAAKGRADDPWDIASALAGQQKVAAGDTLWLLEGTYKVPFKSRGGGFPVDLVGTATSPIHVRAQTGKRVTIDGGLAIAKGTAYLWVWDLEITVSEPLTIGTRAKPALGGS